MNKNRVQVKKGQKIKIRIDKILFPGTGIANINDKEIRVKNVLPGQTVKVLIKKKKKNYYRARLLEIIKKAPNEINAKCKHYKDCGGCNRQTISYRDQLEIKSKQIKELFQWGNFDNFDFWGITPSPRIFEYRNKMEFSFGDLQKGGKLQLGMHPRGKRFDVVTVNSCQLVEQDFRSILTTTINYFRKTNLKKYHVINRQGFLRHLVIRKGLNTGEILINLITTSRQKHDLTILKNKLQNIKLEGKLAGFLQTINDDFADAVKCDKLITYYGNPYFHEKIMNLKFKITPFAFFQPNTMAAEKLYKNLLEIINNIEEKAILDLYSGTGTISQIIAGKAKKVTGIEINKEAVQMARQNAKLNNLGNCYFIAGDVLDKIEVLDVNEKPDIIIVDPPRPGINPQALRKILKYNINEFIYVSCNPRSLIRDLKTIINNGYNIKKVKCVDMFPHTHHIETIVYLNK